MASSFRWGILGPGNIAQKFAEGLKALPDAELAAVGSRDIGRATAFGKQYGAARCHGSYEALANDSDVDIVYIATPHPMHKAENIRCLQAGKAVLCEKPFTVNRQEADAVFQAARGAQRFCMEAMWTRFLPVMEQVRQWLSEGRIGEPRMVQADFGFRADINEESRLFAMEYAGGGLLDVGVYCVSLAVMVFGGPPDRVTGLAHLGETGADEQGAYVLGYPGGRLAVLHSAIRTNTPQDALIMGTKGMIRVHPPFWCGNSATLSVEGQAPQQVTLPMTGNGYNYQAAAAQACMRAGRLECDLMSWQETLSVMDTLDRIRAVWGLKYPMED